MESDLLSMLSYDWRDAWLLQITQGKSELRLTADVRDIERSKIENKRIYQNVAIELRGISKIEYNFCMNHHSNDEDICSIDSLIFELIDGKTEICLELEYGRIFVRAESLRLTAM